MVIGRNDGFTTVWMRMKLSPIADERKQESHPRSHLIPRFEKNSSAIYMRINCNCQRGSKREFFSAALAIRNTRPGIFAFWFPRPAIWPDCYCPAAALSASSSACV
jgi:hypothetical protein